MGESQESPVRKLDVPFDALPAFAWIPPMTGEGEGPVHGRDGAGMRTGEESEGVGKAVSGFGGDMDGKRRAVSLQGQGRGRGLGRCPRGALCPAWWGILMERALFDTAAPGFGILEFEAVRLECVEKGWSAEAACAKEGFQAGKGVCELVGVAQGVLEEMLLGFSGQGGSEAEGPGCHGCGGVHGVEMTVEDPEESGRVAGGFGKA